MKPALRTVVAANCTSDSVSISDNIVERRQHNRRDQPGTVDVIVHHNDTIENRTRVSDARRIKIKRYISLLFPGGQTKNVNFNIVVNRLLVNYNKKVVKKNYVPNKVNIIILLCT